MTYKIDPLHHSIHLKKINHALVVRIETQRLLIRSINKEDEKNFIGLFTDPVVMQKFAEGKPIQEVIIKEYFNKYLSRWKSDNPFAAFAIFEKESQEFMGFITPKNLQTTQAGETEISFAIHYKFWGKGYGSEAAVVFHSLIPLLMMRGYKVEHWPLKRLVATARLDNLPSQKLLISLGFKIDCQIEKFGAVRNHFSLSAKKLKNDYHYFFVYREQQLFQQQYQQKINEDVDVTAEEMAKSPFGRQSNTGKKFAL